MNALLANSTHSNKKSCNFFTHNNDLKMRLGSFYARKHRNLLVHIISITEDCTSMLKYAERDTVFDKPLVNFKVCQPLIKYSLY